MTYTDPSLARRQSGVDADPLTPVEWFVGEMVADLGLGDRSVDLRRRRILLRLTAWATVEGIPLDREAILDPETVERFCTVALRGERSQATYRADLRRLGPLLTTRAPWERRPAAMASRNVAVPYTRAEVALLVTDAAGQPSAARRRGARALLALGLGAGLDGRWVGKVVAGDVAVSGDVVTVRVGEPSPRSVVVRAEWEDEVLDLAKSAGDDCLIGGRSSSRNRVGDLAKRLVCPAGHPRMSAGRLRATWLTAHLEGGTRLPELCAAAGLQGFEVLSELVAFLDPMDETAAKEMLRGGER